VCEREEEAEPRRHSIAPLDCRGACPTARITYTGRAGLDRRTRLRARAVVAHAQGRAYNTCRHCSTLVYTPQHTSQFVLVRRSLGEGQGALVGLALEGEAEESDEDAEGPHGRGEAAGVAEGEVVDEAEHKQCAACPLHVDRALLTP
jgi:hypothetical protein